MILHPSDANGGHLPNALNLTYTSVLDENNQSLKSLDKLKERKHSLFSCLLWLYFLCCVVFTRAGVDLSKPTIYTCQSGTTASTLAFVAHLLGQKSLSVYNVSEMMSSSSLSCTRSLDLRSFVSMMFGEKSWFSMCEIKLGYFPQNLRAVWSEESNQTQQYSFETNH